ncbi:hypothetical protein [Furfurilactobacillus milii]|uniref:Uncharacterized protein n=1 Tax=Furfurilactobacillus milii TaxID=2888272 RepID=A0A6N9I439_9LACO|nr:hypothetical protein [Furfurilactobacillus milii]MYV17735.1 hypothetical protein [Furfurilactobacillus milii]
MKCLVNKSGRSLTDGVSLLKNELATAKLIQFNFDVRLQSELRAMQMSLDRVITPYSFFCKINLPQSPHIVSPLDLQLPTDGSYESEGSNVNYFLGHGHHKLAQIDNWQNGSIHNYNLFGINDRLVSHDEFDENGQKRIHEVANSEGKIVYTEFLNKTQLPAIELYKTNGSESIRLTRYNDHSWDFDTKKDFFDFFVKELQKQYVNCDLKEI